MSHYRGQSHHSHSRVLNKNLAILKNARKHPPESGLGVPHAPIGRRLVTAADKDLARWREMLDKEYPLMTPEQISRF